MLWMPDLTQCRNHLQEAKRMRNFLQAPSSRFTEHWTCVLLILSPFVAKSQAKLRSLYSLKSAYLSNDLLWARRTVALGNSHDSLFVHVFVQVSQHVVQVSRVSLQLQIGHQQMPRTSKTCDRHNQEWDKSSNTVNKTFSTTKLKFDTRSTMQNLPVVNMWKNFTHSTSVFWGTIKQETVGTISRRILLVTERGSVTSVAPVSALLGCGCCVIFCLFGCAYGGSPTCFGSSATCEYRNLSSL